MATDSNSIYTMLHGIFIERYITITPEINQAFEEAAIRISQHIDNTYTIPMQELQALVDARKADLALLITRITLLEQQFGKHLMRHHKEH